MPGLDDLAVVPVHHDLAAPAVGDDVDGALDGLDLRRGAGGHVVAVLGRGDGPPLVGGLHVAVGHVWLPQMSDVWRGLPIRGAVVTSVRAHHTDRRRGPTLAPVTAFGGIFRAPKLEGVEESGESGERGRVVGIDLESGVVRLRAARPERPEAQEPSDPPAE